ncbi:MAG: radical SAM protein, partial [Rikenellaceae bacterium]|nr:radical SAM protein [Rikenellaceae bacterium]
MWLCRSWRTPHTIQVWGIVSFILLRVFHNLLRDKRNRLHTFFFITHIWRRYEDINWGIYMLDTSYYRPAWTCGRYNPSAQVALMYNLIEGKSFFFESYSAQVIAEILATKRNEIIDIDAIASKTGVASESIVEFIEESLIEAGLITNRIFSKEETDKIRRSVGSMMKANAPRYTFSNLKEEQIIGSQTAEMEYNKYMDANSQIQTVLFELTYNCSAQCLHCYNMGATRNSSETNCRGTFKEMSIEDYKRVIDELDCLGCYKVCLSGGDPFSKPIVWDIIAYLYDKEIAFDIFTNGLSLQEQDVERLIDYYPRLVGISIYSGISEVHDKITRIKGSLNRSLSVASHFSKYGVPLTFKCVVMKPNIKSYHLVKQLAIEYGAVCQIEANLCMGVDGMKSNIQNLPMDSVAKFASDLSSRDYLYYKDISNNVRDK